MKAKVFVLLLGVVIGLAGAVIFPVLRERLTPGVLKSAPTEGLVEDKRSEPDRLLLTLVTPDGAVLATFTKRVPEIDLLVGLGDTVSLALNGYRPFVEDPEIERVVKMPPSRQEAQAPADTPAESPVEMPDESPVEATAESPAETPDEGPAETPAEGPAAPSGEGSPDAPPGSPLG